jgi:sugar phosphate isomerase/epimerase
MLARGFFYEIRSLKDRIASFHFKDGKSYLGEGTIKFEPIAAAINDIGYKGWICQVHLASHVTLEAWEKVHVFP